MPRATALRCRSGTLDPAVVQPLSCRVGTVAMWRATCFRRPAPDAGGPPDLEVAGTLGRTARQCCPAPPGPEPCCLPRRRRRLRRLLARVRGAARSRLRPGTLRAEYRERSAATPTCCSMTGPLTRAMRLELQAAWAAMPEPQMAGCGGRVRHRWRPVCRQLRRRGRHRPCPAGRPQRSPAARLSPASLC